MKKIIMSGDIGYDVRPERIERELDEAAGADLDVYLSGPGGYVSDGIEVFNLFRDYKRKHPGAQMMLTIRGLAASMDTYIAVNPAWDLIAAEDNVPFMIHNVWGGAVGDYREMRKTAEIFEGLTGILAKAYADRTGKKVKEIRQMMDDETWFFGEELLENGFADEIIKTDGPVDRAAIITEAKARESMLAEKMAVKTDIQKVAALIQPQNPYPNEHAARIIDPDKFEKDSFRRKNITDGIDIIIGHLKGETTMTTQAYRFDKEKFTVAEAKKWLKDHDIEYISFEPASNGKQDSHPAAENSAGKNTTQEGKTMTLAELLSQHPAAKKEYDAEMSAQFDAGKKSMQATITTAAKYLGPDGSYPAPIKSLAVDVLNGVKTAEALETTVAAFDALRESKNSESAKEEQPKDTPGQQPPVEDEMQSQLKNDKAKLGLKMEV